MTTSPTPALALPSTPAADAGHGTEPSTRWRRPNIHLLRLRPDGLPELASVPLARHPSGAHQLIHGLDQVAIASPPQAWAKAVAGAEHRMRALLTYLWDRGPADVLASDALVLQ
ncbi:MAG TPA: hypothetical protein VFV66_35960 [Nonomuraea sp.]|nr:hypothetical protein [Nonomuraea sp.]